MTTPVQYVGLVNLAAFIEALMNEVRMELETNKDFETVIANAQGKLDVFISNAEGQSMVENYVLANIEEEVTYQLWDMVSVEDRMK